MGRKRRRGAGPHGVLLVDKPEGPTSFDVIAQLRRALGTRSLGHTGTLDPLASGLLVVLAGNLTRLSAYLTRDDKRYTAKITFGQRTTTDDREGDVVEQGDPAGLTAERVREALAAMVGPQEQRPPAFSAVSVGGERLYMKARRGEAVEAPARSIVLHRLDLLAWDPPSAVVDVLCSKGSYVRSIARDLGEVVGVPAHLGGLRRTAAGAYALDEAVSLDDALEEGRALEHLLTGPDAVRGMPRVDVDEAAAVALGRGQRPALPPGVGELEEGRVALAVEGDAMIALVERAGDQLKVVRGFGARS